MNDDWKPDPQMEGWHYRDMPHGREHTPTWIVELAAEMRAKRAALELTNGSAMTVANEAKQ